MKSRKGLVRAAAFAAIAVTGASRMAMADVSAARADSAGSVAGVWAGPASSPLVLSNAEPVYLDDTTLPLEQKPTSGPATAPMTPTSAASPTPTPLMAVLGPTGISDVLNPLNITIQGHAEGSYTYQNEGHPPGNFIDGRIFDVDNEQPELNQLMFAVERAVDYTKPYFDVGAHFEMMWGTDARFIHALGEWDTQHTQYQFDVTQAYVDFAIPVGSGMRIRAGKFVTLAGYEVIDPTSNPLFSHSFEFGYAIPFTQTGAYLTYNLTPKLVLDLGSTRGWDTSLKSYNDNWDGIGRLAWNATDTLTITADTIIGRDEPERNSKYRELFDLIATQTIGDYTAVTFNGDYGHEDASAALGGRTSAQWYGAAGYYQVALDHKLTDTPTFVINARAEYFNDDKGVRVPGAIGTGVELFEGTLGVSITPFRDNPLLNTLKFRPEVRVDYANKSFFDAGTNRYQFTAAIEAIYKF